MAPAFEQAAAELEPDFRFLKVDADEEQQLMAKFGIRSIPTTMLFSHGSVVAQPAGAMSAGGIAAWVKSHSVPSPTAEITGRSFALSADSQHDLAEHVALREAGVGFGGVCQEILRIDRHLQFRRLHSLVERCEFAHPADRIIADARNRTDRFRLCLHPVQIGNPSAVANGRDTAQKGITAGQRKDRVETLGSDRPQVCFRITYQDLIAI
jgi:thiol-disulfide isomerase/thioredoxin